MTSDDAQTPVVLAAEGIVKRFGTVDALRGVDLIVRRGQWLGLLGPNGAGKTTLMQIVVGLLQSDGGTLTLNGEAIDPGRRRRASPAIGFIPQEIALYPTLTARENLVAFARFHGVSRQAIPSRLDWALTWTGLGERQHQRVASFSGGMKRRLNIACGVLHQPDLVLLDEPTVGVDPHARQHIWSMLDGLRQQGASIVHSSHQLDEVEATCDRVVIIDRGRNVAEGGAHDLLGQRERSLRRVTLRLSATPPDDAFGPAFRVDDAIVTGSVDEPARGLKEILAVVESLGLELLEIRIEAPRLEDAFTELTGRELRD